MASHTKYIALFYGLIFLGMSLFFLWKTRKTTSSPIKNIFWAFTAFLVIKAMSTLSELSLNFFVSDTLFSTKNMPLVALSNALSIISSITSNVFLFHFGISILTYKTSIRIDYKFFPVVLFIIYMGLILSGIIEINTAERISRYSFGFNGAFLGSIGYFNLYNMAKKHHGEKRLLLGHIICGTAIFFYAITEGVIIKPVLGIQVEILRLLTAITLFISSFYILELQKEEHKDRIGYV